MKTRFLLFLLTTFFLFFARGCDSAPQIVESTKTDIPAGNDTVLKTVVYAKIHDDMPEFAFIFELSEQNNIDYYDYQIDKIIIKNNENSEFIQELVPSEYAMFGKSPLYYDVSNDLYFAVQDMNFDRYADIRIIDFLPAGPNVPYICWVWDIEDGQYVYDAALSGINAIEVDFENEIMWASERISGGVSHTNYYRYNDGVLTKIKEIRTEYDEDEDEYYATTYELIEGQWIMTNKEIVRFAC